MLRFEAGQLMMVEGLRSFRRSLDDADKKLCTFKDLAAVMEKMRDPSPSIKI